MLKNTFIILLTGCCIFLVLFALFYLFNVSKLETKQTNQSSEASSTQVYTELNDDQIKVASDEILSVLQGLYLESQKEQLSNSQNSSDVIFQLINESMQDDYELEELLPSAQALAKNPNEIISTVGLTLAATIAELQNSNKNFLSFLRTLDTARPSMTEVQYQAALYTTSNKKAYTDLIKGGSIYPTIFLDLSGSSTAKVKIKISSSTKEYILNDIDEKFGEAFAKDDADFKVSQTNNAVLILVRNYRDFLTGNTATTTDQ